METTEVETKNVSAKQERVSLDEESALRVDQWVDQVLRQVPGIKIGRSELVRWLILSHEDVLRTEELLEIKSRFFDEMEFALWMVRQLKESRAKGEKLSLNDLLAGTTPSKRTRRKTVTTSELSPEVTIE